MPHIMKDKKKYGGGSAPGPEYTAGDGIVIENDEISVDEMSAEDMAEIVTPLPSVMSRRMKYSTEEQVVGEWIDGKPIYQKVFTVTMPSSITDGTTADKRISFSELGIVSLDTLVTSYASAYFGNVFMNIPVAYSSSNVVYFTRYTFEVDSNKALYLASNRKNFENIPVTFIIQYTKTTD